MSKLQVWLGFAIAAFALAILAAPFALVIIFPETGGHLADIARTAYGWIVVLFLFGIFNEGVKQILVEIARFVSRVRKVSAGGASADLDQQGTVQLSPGEAEELRARFNTLDQQSKSTLELARTYFLKYVVVTIYGSQVELLQDLLAGPKTTQQALGYYNLFRERAPEDTRYKFSEWINYLASNVLVQYDADSDNYQITDAGRLFTQRLTEAGYDLSRFHY